MNIAVTGGTGTVGRPTVEALRARGHDVRVLSRRAHGPGAMSVDLVTGEGLTAALAGVDVVVDASNSGPSARAARAVLVEGGRRLLEAERRAGVGHHLAASIVGIDDVPLGYYRVKVEQEQVVREGGVPFTIVRATQLHSMLAALFCAASARARVLPVGPARLQTVDAAEVAGLLADIAEAAPRDGVVTIAGPETRTLTDIARTYRASSERRRALLVPVVPPGRLGRKLRAGALTDPRPYRRGTTTFAQWLARR